MKEWQKQFLSEISVRYDEVKEEDFDEVFAFLLNQTSYAKKRTILNFVGLIKKSILHPQERGSTNYRILSARAKEYMSAITPKYQVAFALGNEYICAYRKYLEVQDLLRNANASILQMERDYIASQETRTADILITARQGKTEELSQEAAIAQNTGIELLGLNPASYNRLKRLNINNVYQLCRMSEEEITAIKGIGEKNHECIRQCLHIRGYRFGMFG